MPGTVTKIALPGAAGRMGQMIRSVVAEQPEFELAALSEHPDNPLVGSQIDGVSLSADPAALGIGAGGLLLILPIMKPHSSIWRLPGNRHSDECTTGLKEQEQILAEAARDIPLVIVPTHLSA